MLISFLYILLAILALTFLIFIHELGHYWMAKRAGMRVETFSIGFGKPIFSWESGGTKWQVGWLLFGGFVKIAGMEMSDKEDPYKIEGGFFSKRPIDRIKVLVMGPLVNIVFALVAFAVLWGAGGRQKEFMEYTQKIGWVDPKSELYAEGVRPGDEVVAYNGHAFQSVQDHFLAPMTSSDQMVVEGEKIDYATGQKKPFTYAIKPYPHPRFADPSMKTGGILNPAHYIIVPEGSLKEGYPLHDSGVLPGDRLVWVDGELVFSLPQLQHMLNDGRALLTVKRDNDLLLRRVPRVEMQELKLTSDYKEELIDWKFEAQLTPQRFSMLEMIPYLVNDDNVVQERANFIDPEIKQDVFPKHAYSSVEEPLKVGDQIVAVDGKKVRYPYQLLKQLQEKHVNVIVERDLAATKKISWGNADTDFDAQLEWKDVDAIARSVGANQPVKSSGDFVLLSPSVPKKRMEFGRTAEEQAMLQAEYLEHKKQIEAIDDAEKRSEQLQLLEERQNELILIPVVQDRKVGYNPNPFVLFKDVSLQMWRTLKALVTGATSPKWMAGPIGIINTIKEQSMTSWKEMIFWVGFISLNLGILNLFPIPPFDGGQICLTIPELISGRRLKPKTVEKLVYPFAILVIAFFLFVTYHDIYRIFGKFFH